MSAQNSGAPSPIRVALATCPELPHLDADTQWLVSALLKKRVRVAAAVWDDPHVDWAEFDLVVVRSCWDYASRRDEFLAWAERVPHLANPAPILTWNTDKHYLSDLANSGIPVIPTNWIGPEDHWVLPDRGEWVIKPAISIASLDTEGETALVFLGSEFSHALRKSAILEGPDAGIDRRFQPYGGQALQIRQPTKAQFELAQRVLDAVPCDRNRLLYARVDIVPAPDGSPVLMELELTEPVLYFGHVPQTADRMAAAILAQIEARD